MTEFSPTGFMRLRYGEIAAHTIAVCGIEGVSSIFKCQPIQISLFLDRQTLNSLHPNKVFTVLCCIKYISNIISPDSDLKRNILSIIGDGGNLLNLQEMGFPKNWKFLDVWK